VANIINNANNRVLTATGIQGEALAESGLTYDGQVLVVSGDTQTYGEDYVSSASVSGIGSGETSILTISSSNSSMATFDYYVNNGTAFRGGTVIAAWDGSTTTLTDYSADSGDSTAFAWKVTIGGGNLILTADISSGTWTVKVGARLVF